MSSEFELKSYDVNSYYGRKGSDVPIGAWIVLAVLGLGMIGSCANMAEKVEKERAAQAARR